MSKSLFGLPEKIKVCQKCTYTNQKPNSTIEFRSKVGDKKTGLLFNGECCSACSYSETKDKEINWEYRRKELMKVCDKFRSNSNQFDCIVPGSGGKDSFYAALVLKEEFGMNPLTVTWAPHIYTEWGWQNFKMWIDSGLPNYLYHPNGAVHRFLSRLALENFLHPFQPFILGQYGFPLHCSQKFGIKLVFYGENSAEYGNNPKDNLTPTRSYKDIGLINNEKSYVGGIEVEEISKKYDIPMSALSDYIPPKVEDIAKSEMEWHYLGFYLKWHPQANYYFATKYKFQPAPERNAGSFSRYSGLDDKMDDFNYYFLYVKYGQGRASYDTAQEIRRGDINRDEAKALIERYDGEYPTRFENEVYEYWSINKIPGANQKMIDAFEVKEVNRKYIEKLSDKFRSPHLWKYDKNKKNWKLNYDL